MPHVVRSALLPFSAEQVFRVVDDVRAYPEFLPWCAAATEEARDEDEVVATLVVSRAGVRQAFSTRNRRHPWERLELHLVDGPFEAFDGTWTFTQLGEEGCKVALDLDFEVNRLVRAALEPVLNRAVNSMVDAFCERAFAVYGAAGEAAR